MKNILNEFCENLLYVTIFLSIYLFIYPAHGKEERYSFLKEK